MLLQKTFEAPAAETRFGKGRALEGPRSTDIAGPGVALR